MHISKNYILPLFLGLLLAVPSQAASKKKKGDSNIARFSTHYIDVWAGAGYSGLVNSYSAQTNGIGFTGTFDPKFIGGGGGMIGFGYEWQYKKFLFNVGPEFRLFTSQDNFNFSDPYNRDFNYTDMSGTYPQTYHFQFGKVDGYSKRNFHETSLIGQVMLPIKFGAKFDKWYFLAGAKVGYTLLGNWTQRGNLTRSVTDKMAVDEWYNLYNQQVQTTSYVAKSSDEGNHANKFGLDVVLSAEAGINVEDFLSDEWNAANNKRKYPFHFRVAAFIDYGLPVLQNVQEGTALETIALSGSGSVPEVDMSSNSIHQSEWASGKLNTLLVGVKGTFLLQLNKPKGHKPITPQLASTVMAKENPSAEPKAIKGAVVYTQSTSDVNAKTKKPKAPKKATTNAQGATLSKLKEGTYNVWATMAGYFPSDTITDLTLVEPEAPKSKKEKPEPERVSFQLLKIPVWTVNVKDAKSGAALAAKVQIVDENGGVLLDTAIYTAAETGSSQFAFADKKYLGQNYRVTVSADNHIYTEGAISDIYGEDTYLLEPIIPKKEWILQNMYFATNRTEILPLSEESLQLLFEFLSENPGVRIKIIGHTDSVGSEQSNQILSEGRSASVKAEMVKRGIDADRMETDGRGESEPIDTNDTEEGRQNNRRVVIQVL